MPYYSYFVHGETKRGTVITEVVKAKDAKGAEAKFRKLVSVRDAPQIIGVFKRERILHPRFPVTLRAYSMTQNERVRITPKTPRLRR